MLELIKSQGFYFMYWVNFLHIYQPGNQVKEIFDRVVSECYAPLIDSLLNNPKISLNINAVLTERLNKDYPELIEKLKTVASRGQIEFTDSAKYHALLPLLPDDEVERQLSLNRETNQKILGDGYQALGVFPPEMAFSPRLLPILEKMGYKWILVDEIAYNGKLNQLKKSVTYKIHGSNLNIFFRERAPSNLIMSAMVRHEEDLRFYLKEEYGSKDYMVTGMDGETFGHHRPGLQTLLTELLTSNEFEHSFFIDLLKVFPESEEVNPVVSTWASSQKDIEEQIQFISWNEPNNQIQKLQWELQRLVMTEVKAKWQEQKADLAREKLDVGLASDQFFWSCATPWWSLETIELGAWTLLDSLRSLPNYDQKIVDRAYELYLAIIAMAFEWQRSGKVRQLAKDMKEAPRIPFKKRTVEAGEPWVYDTFIDLMKKEMKKAADKENFEEAVLWRDAVWKLETKNDIFDAIHAVDLLRHHVPNIDIENLIKKYKADYDRLVSGQPEQRAI